MACAFLQHFSNILLFVFVDFPSVFYMFNVFHKFRVIIYNIEQKDRQADLPHRTMKPGVCFAIP